MDKKQKFVYQGREYKTAESGRALILMRRHLAKKKGEEAALMAAINAAAPNNRSPAKAPSGRDALLTPAQAEALETVQTLCREMLAAAKLADEQNAVYHLALPRLMLSEVVTHLMQIDHRIQAAKQAARHMGVAPVTEDKSIINRIAAALKAA